MRDGGGKYALQKFRSLGASNRENRSVRNWRNSRCMAEERADSWWWHGDRTCAGFSSFTHSCYSVVGMSSSCQQLVQAFRDCVIQSDCVQRDGRLPSQCLREHANELPEECQALRKATFECKRGMVSLHCSRSYGACLKTNLAARYAKAFSRK
jgi:cytochrome c oxidase assembly factor 5